MNNLANWHDNIEEALGGDFDSSLSGLCIMSLSFDMARERARGTSSSMISGANNKENSIADRADNGQHVDAPNTGVPSSSPSTSSSGKCINYSTNQNETENNTNWFKRFKHSTTAEDQANTDARYIEQDKMARKLQQMKNCLTTNPQAQNPSQNNENSVDIGRQYGQNNTDDQCQNSTHESETDERASQVSTNEDDDSSLTSGHRSRSASPAQSSSSIASHSGSSSRSQSPSMMSARGSDDADKQSTRRHRIKNKLRRGIDEADRVGVSDQPGAMNTKATSNEEANQADQSARDNLLGGSSLKECSFNANIASSNTSMHFKNINHAFSLKSFPLSPFHQFSNSSFNHDFYDRYMSLDSRQPLQTPLIGIERTQDLLSLRLPPHGLDDADYQRLGKDKLFEDNAFKSETISPGRAINGIAHHQNEIHKGDTNNQQGSINEVGRTSNNQQDDSAKRKSYENDNSQHRPIGEFPFSFKSNSKQSLINPRDSPSYGDDCCNDQIKNSIFHESMRHFNQDKMSPSPCCQRSSKKDDSSPGDVEDMSNMGQHCQETMFGIDASKQRFQYFLSAPISVATKLNEDTMTYLNQCQAYEIKLENMTDMNDAKRGFMSSIINIGFHERHMQQAEAELWHQWVQQHPNEKIFTVDMKLSYNVFGVESDSLNRYKFLWDSSKIAGLFLRMNSISTEFTPKKHGGEKGVPFKLSIETSVYNSKTHESYFVSAACCQIKVFKPKGAERKIRSDRDKISKRPMNEQDKYHRSCDQTVFRECTLTSIHPIGTNNSAICYYRLGNNPTKHQQGSEVDRTRIGGNDTDQMHQNLAALLSDGEMEPNSDQARRNQHHQQNEEESPQSVDDPSSNDNDNRRESDRSGDTIREYQDQSARGVGSLGTKTSDYPSSRLMVHGLTTNRSNIGTSPDHHNTHPHLLNHITNNQHQNHNNHNNTNTNPQSMNNHNGSSNEQNYNHSSDLLQHQQPMYHTNQVRTVTGLTTINTSNIGHLPYYNHTLPTSIQGHLPSAGNYNAPTSGGFGAMNHNPHFTPNCQTHHNLTAKPPATFHRSPNPTGRLLPTVNPTSSNIFRASNLAITSHHHNNFHSYIGSTNEHCIDQSDSKDHTTGNANYHDEPFDTHLSGNGYLGSANGGNQVTTHTSSNSSIRQRSASSSIVSGPVMNCSSYITSPGQLRQPHSYSNSGLPESHFANNSWIPQVETMGMNNNNSTNHTPTGHNDNHQMSSPVCSQKSQNVSLNPGSATTNNDNDHNSYQQDNQNYDCNNQNYDSDQNSPRKNHNTASNSSSSCCSRYRANPSVTPCIGAQPQVISENSRLMTNFHGEFPSITINSSCTEVLAWFNHNRFGGLAKILSNFSGSDLLRLSKSELIEICGLIDGIRLFNNLHNSPMKPRRALYFCLKGSDIFHPIYLYDVSLKELLNELSKTFCQHIHKVVTGRYREEKQQNSINSRQQPSNSGSGSDSRSSLNAITGDGSVEDVYGRVNELVFDGNDIKRATKIRTSKIKSPRETGPPLVIDRLLIEGLTPVKIVATDQVIQTLEEDSVWSFLVMSKESDIIEACITINGQRHSAK